MMMIVYKKGSLFFRFKESQALEQPGMQQEQQFTTTFAVRVSHGSRLRMDTGTDDASAADCATACDVDDDDCDNVHDFGLGELLGALYMPRHYLPFNEIIVSFCLPSAATPARLVVVDDVIFQAFPRPTDFCFVCYFL